MAGWVKNLTAAAQVAVRTQVKSPTLLQLQLSAQLLLRFDPWPGNFDMLWVCPPHPQNRNLSENKNDPPEVKQDKNEYVLGNSLVVQ